MAKESMKAREVKRAKTVAKYAEKRKALKEAGDYESLQFVCEDAHFMCSIAVSALYDICCRRRSSIDESF